MSIFYEMDKNFGDLLDEKKNFLFIGEAGSGKSEIVLNVAAKLAEKTGSRVQVFDMDPWETWSLSLEGVVLHGP